ncbi:DUF2332 domain-containing protein [Sinosporangium siamense]|nr:DUF2332 domain-containing protein [Sinosporangium siamense]
MEATAEEYRRFGEVHVRGSSALYERLALGVAGDEQMLELLVTLPKEKRQPNLLFGAVRYLRGTTPEYPDFRAYVLSERELVARTMMSHRTQTNEPARCAALLAVMAGLPGPFALLEVGASAGLCLLPDRYAYDYDGHRIGPPGARPTIRCAVTGRPRLPPHVPEVVWRAGIDLNPLDVNDDDEVRWLEALVWPEHDERRTRLRAALEVARADPPRVVSGDLNTMLDKLAAEVPQGATLVVYHSAVLMYLSPVDRNRFADQVMGLPGHWIAQEDPSVLSGLVRRMPARPENRRSPFLVALDGEPVAFAGSHGGWIEWLDES